MYGFDNMQKASKENMDTMMETFGTFSKSVQAIAVEVADYQKKAFEDTTAAAEKMMGAKSLDKVLEVQSEYAKSTYEEMVSQATKMSELYMDLAKDTYKPFESMIPKAAK
ncbi:MAG: phasin family protein [Pseudomonadota bacterium]